MSENDSKYYGYVDPGPYPINDLEENAPIGAEFILPCMLSGEKLVFTIINDTEAKSGGLYLRIEKINGRWHQLGQYFSNSYRSIIQSLIGDKGREFIEKIDEKL